MRLTLNGTAVGGTGSSGVYVGPKQLIPPAAGTATVDPTTSFVYYQAADDTIHSCYQDGSGDRQMDPQGANLILAGGGMWAAWLEGDGVRCGGSLRLPAASLLAVTNGGAIIVCPDYATGLGLSAYLADGTLLWTYPNAQASFLYPYPQVYALDATRVLWRDGSGTLHTRGLPAPAQAAPVVFDPFLMVAPDATLWVGYHTGDDRLLLHPLTDASKGYALATGLTFGTTATDLHVGYSRTSSESVLVSMVVDFSLPLASLISTGVPPSMPIPIPDFCNTATEQELRKWRGSIATTFWPGPHGIRPNKDDNPLFTAEWTNPKYSKTYRASMLAAYPYTHMAIGPIVQGGYGDVWPRTDFTNNADAFLDMAAEIWDAHKVPAIFLIDDTGRWGGNGRLNRDAIERELTPLYSQPRWQALARVVVLAWEPDYTADDWQWGVKWMARVFPNALRYIHFESGHGAPGRGSELKSAGGTYAEEKDMWEPVVPYIHGLLHQETYAFLGESVDAGRTPEQQTVYSFNDLVERFHDGKAGWPTRCAAPRPLDVVAFEYGSYAQFKGGPGRFGTFTKASVASVAMGDQLLREIPNLAGVGDGCTMGPAPTPQPTLKPETIAAVTLAYNTLLNRNPDPYGLNYYGTRLEDGRMDNTAMQVDIMASDEYKTLHPTPQPPADPILDAQMTYDLFISRFNEIDDAVVAWYVRVYGRRPAVSDRAHAIWRCTVEADRWGTLRNALADTWPKGAR